MLWTQGTYVPSSGSFINNYTEKKSDYISKNTGHAFVAGFVLAIRTIRAIAFRAVVPCENSSKSTLLWLQETHLISA